MGLKPRFCVLCSVLTVVGGCSDDAITPGASGGSAGGGSAGIAGMSPAGGSSSGMPSGGTNAESTMAGTMSASGMGGAGTAGAGGSAAGTAGGGGTAGALPVCGDGKKEGTEACDDGDDDAADGCSATCALEAGYACNSPGQPCAPVCGDGTVIAPEKCDDQNTSIGDGCNATCQTEAGWECKTAGAACTGICGDGILADELCDDHDQDPNDGCSATCQPEPGFVCDVPGSSCRKMPDCSGGACVSTCGDGIVIGEQCDDGNLEPDDGCSATCETEPDYTCETVAAQLPKQLAIAVTYRDFVSVALGGSTKFPDQIAFQGQGITPDMVQAELSDDGLPVYTGVCEQDGPNVGDAQKCPFGAQTTSQANFDDWFRDDAAVSLSLPGLVLLERVGNDDKYQFDGGETFTPLTGKGWDEQGKEGLSDGKNFGFTTVLRYFFVYRGDEVFDFSGDDDVWVFINGKLAVDIGGLHPKQTKSVTLGVVKSQQLELTPGQVYELALFHAERRPGQSNFKLTLSGFLDKKSKCTAN
jgi:fibro-slime domain-containing protein